MRYKTINWITNKKSPNYKPTSPQAKRRKTSSRKLRVGPPVSSPSLQAQGSGSQGTSEQAPDPGYRPRG